MTTEYNNKKKNIIKIKKDTRYSGRIQNKKYNRFQVMNMSHTKSKNSGNITVDAK